MKQKKLTYEQALQELKHIVETVERGELEIGQLSDYISRGQQLLAHCKAQLQKVETNVSNLLHDEQK